MTSVAQTSPLSADAIALILEASLAAADARGYASAVVTFALLAACWMTLTVPALMLDGGSVAASTRWPENASDEEADSAPKAATASVIVSLGRMLSVAVICISPAALLLGARSSDVIIGACSTGNAGCITAPAMTLSLLPVVGATSTTSIR